MHCACGLFYFVGAYLYYATNGWEAYSQGVEWSPDDITPSMDIGYMRYTNGTYDGQAQVIIPGPSSSRYAATLHTQTHTYIHTHTQTHTYTNTHTYTVHIPGRA